MSSMFIVMQPPHRRGPFGTRQPKLHACIVPWGSFLGLAQRGLYRLLLPCRKKKPQDKTGFFLGSLFLFVRGGVMMKGSAPYSTKKWGSLLVVEGLFEVYRQMSGIVTWMDGWMSSWPSDHGSHVVRRTCLVFGLPYPRISVAKRGLVAQRNLDRRQPSSCLGRGVRSSWDAAAAGGEMRAPTLPC